RGVPQPRLELRYRQMLGLGRAKRTVQCESWLPHSGLSPAWRPARCAVVDLPQQNHVDGANYRGDRCTGAPWAATWCFGAETERLSALGENDAATAGSRQPGDGQGKATSLSDKLPPYVPKRVRHCRLVLGEDRVSRRVATEITTKTDVLVLWRANLSSK